MRILLTLLALIAMAPASLASSDTDTFAQFYQQKARYEAWGYACEISPYSCIGVPVPKVKFEKMRPGLLGTYGGTDTVYIRLGLRGLTLDEVLLHEMIHYLQSKVGGLRVPGPAITICKAEEEAFTLVDEWLISIGAGWKTVGPNWWKPYGHCHRWYDPNYRMSIWNIINGIL